VSAHDNFFLAKCLLQSSAKPFPPRPIKTLGHNFENYHVVSQLAGEQFLKDFLGAIGRERDGD
jgi:hypothetical protein